VAEAAASALVEVTVSSSACSALASSNSTSIAANSLPLRAMPSK
jgi:hypothetical protein